METILRYIESKLAQLFQKLEGVSQFKKNECYLTCKMTIKKREIKETKAIYFGKRNTNCKFKIRSRHTYDG